jgi:hypothetical protein
MADVDVSLDDAAIAQLENLPEVRAETLRWGEQIRAGAEVLAPVRTGHLKSEIHVRLQPLGEVRVTTEATRKRFKYGVLQERRQHYLARAVPKGIA